MNAAGEQVLGRFRAAISGESRDFDRVVEAYVEVLASRLGAVLARDPDRQRLEASLGALDWQAEGGGLLAAMAWPPVAGILLGRVGATRPACAIADLIDEEAAELPVPGTAVPWRTHVTWLDGLAPGVDQESPVAARVDVDSALRMLQLSPGAAELVLLATRVVVLRDHPDDAVTGSWSTDELIGCSVLVNADTSHGTHEVAEAVLHEAIHHSQGMVEVLRPFIHDPSLVAAASRYPSPWTGAPLTAKSMLAACFVWFGLACFWERARSSESSEHAAARMTRAAAGFVHGDPASEVASFGGAIAPDVVGLVAELQSEARDRWRVS